MYFTISIFAGFKHRAAAWFASVFFTSVVFSGCGGTVANLSSATSGASAIQILTEALTDVHIGEFATGIATAGGYPPLKFTVTAGALPAGTNLDPSTGVISGTIPPSAANQPYAVSLTVTDSAGLSATKTYSGTISAGSALLNNASTTISDFIAGVAYSYPLVILGGAKPYSFSVTNGFLPAGIDLDTQTGLISGTPAGYTGNQSYAFVVTVKDSGSQTINKTYIGTVKSSTASSFSIITATIPTPTAGSAYGASIGVTGGTAPFSFSISSGTLPSGLTINSSSGLISGTVALSTQGSAYLFSVRATDSSGLASTVSYSGFVTAYSTSLVPSSMPSATPGQSFNSTIATLYGQAPYAYSITSGSLPSGLTFNSSTGVISGTVAQSEAGLTKTFVVRSTDTNNIQVSVTYSIATNPFAVGLTTSSLANAVESANYSNASTPLQATGGTAPYTFEYTGTLPTGVGLTSGGVFFGTPAVGSGALPSGTVYTIYVRARDSINQVSAQVAMTMTVTISAPAVDALTPTNAVLGINYSYTVGASGGRAPYSYFVSTGSLPTGLSMSATGVISGIPTALTSCPAGNFTVRVTDSLSQTSTATTKCVTTVNGVVIITQSLPVVVIGTNYSSGFAGSGGTLPYSFTASGLPAGISLNASTGALTGFTNETSGDFIVYATVTDSSTPALKSTRSFTLSVRNRLTLTDATLPRGATGVAYNADSGYQLSSTNGQDPYTYVITSGSLPAGLTMSSSGFISGTPSSNSASYGGNYSFSVVATDALGQSSAAAAMTLNITTAPKIGGVRMPVAVVGNPYAYDLVRLGGVNLMIGSANDSSRVSWALVSPASLPSGLTLDAARGRIYGTPTAGSAGSYALTFSVTDQYGFTGSKTLNFKINASGKTLDLKTARVSQPCYNNTTICGSEAFAIGKLTNTSQQFLVHMRYDTTPKSLQIAKIDSTGRVPMAWANVTTMTVNFPTNLQVFQTGNGNNYSGQIRISDVDQDGYKDILFSSLYDGVLCVMWGGAGTDTYGMPTGYSAANTNCYPIWNGINTFVVKSDLRPDAENYGKQDIIATSGTTLSILKNNCPANGSCNSAGIISASATTTVGSTTVTLASGTTTSLGLVANMGIFGMSLPQGTIITSAPASSTTFTVSNAAVATGNVTVTASHRGMLFQGFLSVGATTNSNTTVNVSNTAGMIVGSPVVGLGIPQGTSITAITGNTSITLSAAATSSGAITLSTTQSMTVPLSQPGTWASGNTVSMTNTTGMAVGQPVMGTGIPAGAYITAVSANVSITLSANPTSSPGTVYTIISSLPLTTVNGSTTASINIAGAAVPAGGGIPASTTISSVGAGTVTLSQATTSAGTATVNASGLRVVLSYNSGTTSATVTNSLFPGVIVGQRVSCSANCTAFPAIAAILNNTQLTLSIAPTVTGAMTLTAWSSPAHVTSLLTYSTAYSNYLINISNIETGWFTQAKPAFSVPPVTTIRAAAAGDCPSIVVTGDVQTNSNYQNVYVVRQSFINGQCAGDFTHLGHTSIDEVGMTYQSYPRGLAVADFNSDNVSDIAIGLAGAVISNSSNIRIYMPLGAGQVFSGGAWQSPQVQSRSTFTIAVNKLAVMCLDGSSSCAFPSLLATCTPSSSNQSCIAVLPNQCTSTPCTQPFEGATASARIDYSSPFGLSEEPVLTPLVSPSNFTVTGTTAANSNVISNVSSMSGVAVGQEITGLGIPSFSFVTAVQSSPNQITINQNATSSATSSLTLPTVPTLNDLAFGVRESTFIQNFVVFPRNGNSTADPFKGATALDSFPASYGQGVDMGTMRLTDNNNDGLLDLFAFSPGQGAVSAYVSSTSGGVSYSAGAAPAPYYLANQGYSGCPLGASQCYPDPYVTMMGIQQSYPNPNNFYSTSLLIGGPSAFQNTMDVMDVNNDGIPDVGVNGYFSRGVAVALGSLTGDLGVPALFELGKGSDLRPMSFAFRDLDNDGLPDIVVAGINFSASATGVGVAAWLKGNGDGTFQTAVRIDQVVNNCAMPTAVTTVDIDQDGRPEIAVLCSSGQGVFISRRNFDGTWVLQTGVSINSSVGQNHGFSMRFGRVTTSTATGTDLVVAGYDNNGIRIINNISLSVTNSGTGAFSMISSPGSYVWLNGDSVADVTISDLDSDGLNDVVAIPRRTGYGSGGWGYEATHFWTCRSTGVTGQCARLNWGGDGVYQNSVVAGDVRNNDQPDIFISYQVPRLFYRTIARIMNISQ